MYVCTYLYIKVDVLEEKLASVDLFKEVMDTSVGEELAPYLVQLLYKVIRPCLLKHRKRACTKEVILTNIFQ